MAGILLAALPAGAHDLWLVPSSFRPAAGEPVAVRIRVGQDPASAEPLPYRPGWVERFVYAGGSGEGEIRGAPGQDPAGWLRLEAPGVHALGLVSASTAHTLEVPGFERYLAEEGLESAARERAETVYADGEVRETFSRSVKSLVRVAANGAGAPPRDFDEPIDLAWGLTLGLPLELVPLDDPFDPEAGSLRLQVLLRGEPAAGVRVDLRPLDPPDELGGNGAESAAGGPAHAVSDVSISDRWGVVTLPLPGHVTRHLAAATVLVPPEPGSRAEWHSLWTSLTFERNPR